MQEAGPAWCPERGQGGHRAGVQQVGREKADGGRDLPGSWRTRVDSEFCSDLTLPFLWHFQMNAVTLSFHASSQSLPLVQGELGLGVVRASLVGALPS